MLRRTRDERAGMPVIPCRRFRDRLPEYAAGRAVPEETWMTEHLTHCEPCARAYHDLRAVLTTLSRLPEPPSSRDGELAARRAIHVAASDGSAPRVLPWWRVRHAWATAGVLAVGVAVVGLVVRPLPPPRSGEGVDTHRQVTSNVRSNLGRQAKSRPHPRPLSQSWERGERPHSQLPLSQDWERGPGGEGGSPLARSIVTSPPIVAPTDDLLDLNGPRLAASEPELPGHAASGDDFVHMPSPMLADSSGIQMAAALAQQRREAAVVDGRLTRELSLQARGMPMGALCEQITKETGIRLSAGRSVADEKVSLFCRPTPLREIMRNLSRPFGYTWLRSGKPGEYRYELAQDLRSQLAEEELRNRARNAALLALDQDLQSYRRYQGMTPDQIRAALRTAPAHEKPALEKLAGVGWGAIQMYLRLSPAELSALRAGRELRYTTRPEAGEQPLPADVARGALQTRIEPPRAGEGRQTRILEVEEEGPPRGTPPAGGGDGSPRPEVILRLQESERGQFSLVGGTVLTRDDAGGSMKQVALADDLAVGESPSVRRPRNAEANKALATEPALQRRVSVTPKASCAGAGRPTTNDQRPMTNDEGGTRSRQARIHDSVTSADVLEALHKATGMPVVGDFYTRLNTPQEVTIRERPIFEALNRLADTMRQQWRRDGGWLQFRSASHFDDRVKEVPARLLERWSARRREHGALSLAELAEIAALSDAQLDAAGMAEGARHCWTLPEWDLARGRAVRPHLRLLASLTPAQWRAVTGKTGLAFADMTLPQQQEYLSHAFGNRPGAVESLADMKEAALLVEYVEAGGFEWRPARGEAVAARRGGIEAPDEEEGAGLAPVRERTPEAALQAARRIDPRATASQVQPTQPTLSIRYTLGGPDGAVPHALLATPRGVRVTARLGGPGPGPGGRRPRP